MNDQQTASQDNQQDKFNLIEKAISRINAENQVSENSDQIQWKKADAVATGLAETRTTAASINTSPRPRPKARLAALGIACAAIGIAVIWGFIKREAQPKIVSPISNVNVKEDSGSPIANGHSLQMSRQLGDAKVNTSATR